MKVQCPEGWIEDWKFDKPKPWVDEDGVIHEAVITIAHVEICGGYCDSGDLCGKTECVFYDLSHEATEKFCRAQGREHGIEGLFKTEKIKELIESGINPKLLLTVPPKINVI